MKRLLTIVMFTFSFPALAEPLEDAIFEMAREISDSVKEQKKRKIAILPFDEPPGKTTILSTYVPEALTTDLVRLGRFDIKERHLLDTVIAELRRQNKEGAFDPKTAAQAGRIAGVEAVVIGTITDFPGYVAINCRIVDAETATVFGATGGKITKDADLRSVMNERAPAPARPGQPAQTETIDPADRPSYQDSYVYTEVESATRRGDIVSLTIGVHSRHTDERHFWMRNVYLLDENGERWGCKFDNGDDSEAFHLHPRTKRKVRAACRPVGDASGTRFTLLAAGGDVPSIEDIVPVIVKK